MMLVSDKEITSVSTIIKVESLGGNNQESDTDWISILITIVNQRIGIIYYYYYYYWEFY